MMNTAKTLLDSDHPPTLEELQSFFKENDWTGIKILDENSVSPASLETINLNKAVFNPFLESAMKEHGLGAGIKNFDNKVKVDGISFQQNSLVDFGENFKNTVSTLVEKWQRESPDTSQKTIDYYRAKGIDEDDFLRFYTDLALDVTQFDKAAEIIKKNSADEDFNPRKANNFRAIDHRRKWNHTRDKIKLELCPNPDLINNMMNPIVNPEHEAMFNLMLQDYMKALDDTEKKIFYMREQGMSQEDIAKKLGFASNSAVSKRLKKMRELFKEITGY